tara:strand:- start:10 stop:573 length:564 start_codon:yes stop_codon:yes gene_type:complete
MNIRKSVTIDNTLEETDEMPIEYLNQDERQLTKRQRLLVWNAVNDPQLTFAEAAKKAGYKNPVVVGRLMRKKEDSKYAHVRREYERLMSEAKQKFELTHEKAVEDLYKLRDDAWGRGAFNAAIQAQGLLLKVGGLIVDRREVLHGKIDQMSRDEVERRLQDLLGTKAIGAIDNKSGKIIEDKSSSRD